MVSDDLFRLIEAVASVVPTSTEEFGEYFAMSIVQITTAELMPARVYCCCPIVGTCRGSYLRFRFSRDGAIVVHPGA